MPTDDLISKLGAKKSSAEGTGSPGPTQSKSESGSADEKPTSNHTNSRGSDLLNKAGSTESSAAATAKTKSAGESETASKKVETDGSDLVQDPDSWTKESAFREIKKLREENKTTRIKYEESVDKLKTEMESRLSVKEDELKKLAQAQQELEDIKTKEADKKRDLSEKVAHREALIAEMKAKMDAQEKIYQEKISSIQANLSKYQAESEALNEINKQRLHKELETIPEKFKSVADLIVKGAGDPRDALLALSEAKIKGVFEDKTVVVSHAVPGAKDGARATKERLDAATAEVKNKMTSQQKIGEALKQIRSGETNTAFRSNR